MLSFRPRWAGDAGVFWRGVLGISNGRDLERTRPHHLRIDCLDAAQLTSSDQLSLDKPERGAMGVRLCLLLFFQLSDIDALTLALTY